MRSIIPDAGKPARLDRRTLLRGLAGAGCALALPMLAAAQDDAAPPLPSAPESIEIEARPILHFERGKPDAKRFGQLEFRGGMVLTSPSAGFGGWSGLVMEADGSALLWWDGPARRIEVIFPDSRSEAMDLSAGPGSIAIPGRSAHDERR